MNWDHVTNEELLKGYGQGSFEAFDAFFKRNSKIVFLFIKSRLGNHSEAEDVLQETFIRIHKYIHRYDDKRNALNWVLTIAKNQMITQIAKHPHHVELDQAVLPSREHASHEARDELTQMLGILNQDERTLLIDKFLKEENYEEISTRRGLSAANARQKISRILKKLRTNPIT